MTEGRTLGVLGTLVWDTIVAQDPNTPPVEDWGGISYALVAASAALPQGWSVLPIVKVGADLEGRARSFVATLRRVDEGGLTVVAEENNRVELRYHSPAERTERLTGGVPGWSIEELTRPLAGCDALLVNFISGCEMSLETATALRAAFDGPIYADLHSLFLGMDARGDRLPRRLVDWTSWARCFDVVQMNEEEFARCGTDGEGPSLAALDASTSLVIVTLAGRGVWLHGDLDRCGWRRSTRGASGRGWGDARRLPRIVTLKGPPESGDPTGCGDVWGAAMFSRLLAEDAPEEAAAAANRLAALNAAVSGASALRNEVTRAGPTMKTI